MIRSEISCDNNHLIHWEESGFGLLSLNLPSTTLSKNHQDHSPRPSLKSFGSEVRCSIDELDAVIATYDVDDQIESRRQQLLPSSSSSEHLNYSTFTNSPSLSNQLSSLNTSNELSSSMNQSKSKITSITNMNYITSVTHSGVNYHHNTNSINDINGIRKYHYENQSQVNNQYGQLDFNTSSYSPSSSSTFTNCCTQIEPSFPLPPPDAFASEDFPLPPSPPPPPLLSTPTAEATTGSARPVTTHSSSTTFLPFTTNSTLTTLNGGKNLQSFSSTNGYSQCQSFDPKCQVKSTIHSYNTNNGHHTNQFHHNTPTTNSRKPSIPQRDPSTRLTSLPSWPKHHDMETPTSDTMITSNTMVTGNNGIDNLKTKHSVESSKENNNNNNNTHSIECTTLPVQDIIRKFGSLLMSNAKISNQCNTTSNVQSTLSSTIRPNSINDCIPNNNNTNSIKKSIAHKNNPPTPSSNSQYSPNTTGLATPIAFTSQNNAIQEVVMSTTSSSSSSSSPLLNRNINQSSSPDMNHSYQIMNSSSGKLSKGNYCINNNTSSNLPYSFSSNSTNVTITTTVSNHHKSFIDPLYVNGKFGNDKCSLSSNSSYQSITSTTLSEECYQTNSSCTTFNSFGNTPNGLSKLQNRNNSSHSTNTNDVNNSINHHVHSQQSQHHQPLNSNGHQHSGTLLQPRSSSDSSSNSSFIHVQSMNLDPQTLAIFNQFNIVDANQIPGYHPISSGLPDWKVHRLERKNRDAANVYADELKKWGLVPHWKRELIEKKQLNKMETHPHQPQQQQQQQHLNHSISNSNKQSIATNELAEKLQRRLDKVSKGIIE
uniref:SH2 domain-containing protein n=1 Tax=Schistosoma mansoni TaxID=6183 RepID=A0A3Q0KTN4_SCHMA